MRRQFLIALLVALASAAAAASPPVVSAGSGPPKIPFTYTVKIYTQYGLVCSSGSAADKCHYSALPGTAITVTQHGRMLQRKMTNAKGFATVKLPKGVSYLGYSHAPWHGHVFGSKSFSITAPVWLAAGNYLTVTFCVAGAC